MPTIGEQVVTSRCIPYLHGVITPCRGEVLAIGRPGHGKHQVSMAAMFFGPFLSGGKASPPTGAVAGRYDIAEFSDFYGPSYDPDDSSFFSCNQPPPPQGSNYDFYCNPALEALYRQELATADPGVRQKIFDQIHQIYLTELPFIVLYSPIRS